MVSRAQVLTGRATTITTRATTGAMSRSRGCSRRWEKPRTARPQHTQATAANPAASPAPERANHTATRAVAIENGVSRICRTVTWVMNGWRHSQPLAIEVK